MFWFRKKNVLFDDWIPAIEIIAREFGVSVKKPKYIGDDLVISLYHDDKEVGQVNLHHIARLWLNNDIAMPYVMNKFLQTIKQ